jgi:hypothetical protein
MDLKYTGWWNVYEYEQDSSARHCEKRAFRTCNVEGAHELEMSCTAEVDE